MSSNFEWKAYSHTSAYLGSAQNSIITLASQELSDIIKVGNIVVFNGDQTPAKTDLQGCGQNTN